MIDYFVLVDVKVNGLHICVCLVYLISLGDFFTKGMPKPKEEPIPMITPAATKSSTDTQVPGEFRALIIRYFYFRTQGDGGTRQHTSASTTSFDISNDQQACLGIFQLEIY